MQGFIFLTNDDVASLDDSLILRFGSLKQNDQSFFSPQGN
jgi:hypothetical protein